MALELSTDANGWSTFETVAANRTSGSRNIYCDPAASGANDGTSWTDAFTTIGAACSDVVTGKEDHVIIKENTKFTSGNLNNLRAKSGPSNTQPIIVYTENWDVNGCTNGRAWFETDDQLVYIDQAANNADNIALIGLRHSIPDFDGVSVNNHIDITGSGVALNWLIEDCSFFDGGQLNFQPNLVSGNEMPVLNMTLRRCSIYRNFGQTANNQGMFCNFMDGLTVYECVFWYNGHSPIYGKSINNLDRNVYIGVKSGNIAIERSAFMEGSSENQLRAGGTWSNCYFSRERYAIASGADSNVEDYGRKRDGWVSQVDDCVIIDGYNRGNQVLFCNMGSPKTASFARNIVAWDEDADSNEYGLHLLDIEGTAASVSTDHPVTAASWASNVLTITAAEFVYVEVGDSVTLTGFTTSGAAIDGDYTVATIDSPGSNDFTVALGSDPGTISVLGDVLDNEIHTVGMHNLTVEDNVFWHLARRALHFFPRNLGSDVGEGSASNIVIQNNKFACHSLNGTGSLYPIVRIDQSAAAGTPVDLTTSNFTFTDNDYWHEDDAGSRPQTSTDNFYFNGSNVNFADWKTNTGEGGSWVDPSYTDTTRKSGKYYTDATWGLGNSASASGDDDTEATGTVTMASVQAGDTFSIFSVTYTAVSGAKSGVTQFSIDTSDTAAATDLADSINNETRDGHVLTATSSGAVVTIHAPLGADANITALTSSNGTRLAVSDLSGGVDGNRTLLFKLMVANRKGNWNTSLTAPVMNDVVREGFDMAQLESSGPSFLMVIP